MQAIELIIPGKFYDSQIYSGLLYLWTIDGSILTINWDSLIRELSVVSEPQLEFAAFCAFQKSSHLYRNEWQLMFKDEEMKGLLIKRFEELAKQKVEISKTDLSRCIVQEQSNPFPFPHTDSLVYYRTVYVSGGSGLSSSRKGGSRHPINPKLIRHWDAPVLSMAASHKILALAAGSAGTFEAAINPENDQRFFKNQQRSPQPSNWVRWLYYSLFSTSHQGGFLADMEIRVTRNQAGKKREDRRLREVISADKLFESTNRFVDYTWGVHDKICSATPSHINVIKYIPNPHMEEADFELMGQIAIEREDNSGIVSADSALFGYILEYDDKLLIINSELEHMWLPEEPVNWRVFPDSRDYTNHLHVIYDDHLSIFSFVQDYFVDQKRKIAGIEHWTGFKRREFTRFN